MSIDVIVLGAGGHARVLIDAMRCAGIPVIGICAPELKANDVGPFGIRVLGDNSALVNYDRASLHLANGIGSTGNPEIRVRVFERKMAEGWRFATLVHPAATVAGGCAFAEGTQVMAGAIIQTGCRIGCNTIINSSASIDHDCQLGDHVHIAPGAVLCGDVIVGMRSHIGSGAVVIHGVSIGNDVLIGAGAVVTRAVADGERVPAGARF